MHPVQHRPFRIDPARTSRHGASSAQTLKSAVPHEHVVDVEAHRPRQQRVYGNADARDVMNLDVLDEHVAAMHLYAAAAQVVELGVAKEDCIVYEDSTLGIEAGKRAGIFTVAREDNRFLQDQSHADKKVKDIQSLVEWIRKENSHA